MFPIYMGIREKDEKNEFCDMRWGRCDACGCVQILDLVELDILYKRSHNPAIGKSWTRHHEKFSEFVIKNMHGRKVLDVGGANLKIAKKILDKSTREVEYTVVDFSCEKYGIDHRIRQIKCDFSEIEESFDTILHSHTFEHSYDPVEFLKCIARALPDSGTMIMSIPNLENQIKDLHMNALHFEHTFFYDEKILQNILRRSGLEIKEVLYFSDWNSFYVCKKSKNSEPLITSFSEETGILFESFVKKIREDVIRLNNLIERDCFCFGAHIFTQMMLCLGLDRNKIRGIVDNDPDKIGQFLYGSDIEVYSPEEIRKFNQPEVIVRVSQFKEEIQDQIKSINEKAILL